MGRIEASEREAYLALIEEAARIKLVINEAKTKSMMINIPGVGRPKTRRINAVE